jgi:hypothetical protein
MTYPFYTILFSEPSAHNTDTRRHLVRHVLQELYSYSDEIEEWDDVITITTNFSPLQLDSMTKDMQEATVRLEKRAHERNVMFYLDVFYLDALCGLQFINTHNIEHI